MLVVTGSTQDRRGAGSECLVTADERSQLSEGNRPELMWKKVYRGASLNCPRNWWGAIEMLTAVSASTQGCADLGVGT